mmetsp:Transcript_76295/g.166572  ORF Transcript_76295/g.166572 Transcript_76295/m.166572 type:complete len:147 (-) Transcript_76295:743-1183(-)
MLWRQMTSRRTSSHKICTSALRRPSSYEDFKRRAWKNAISSFSKEASTVLKYQDFGRKHAHLFDITKLKAEDMIVHELLQTVHGVLQLENRTEAKANLLQSGLVEEVVEQLLYSGDVDVNKKNKDGNTALMVASGKGHSKVERALK